jgi:hypothetical protein
MMQPSKTPLFDLGQVVSTPAALSQLLAAGIDPGQILHRHRHGDWGDVCPDDWQTNERALKEGSRIFSSYQLAAGVKIWIITEAENEGRRASTCLLLPEDY